MKIIENSLSSFESLLALGKSVLGLTYSGIQQLFFGKEMCLYEYMLKGGHRKGVELALDDAILVCSFTGNTCDTSILYIDKPETLLGCIRYCDSLLEYSYDTDAWLYHDSYLSLLLPSDEGNGKFGFIQHPM